MITFQDLLEVSNSDRDRMEFVRRVIEWHKTTDLYNNSVLAYEYDGRKNRTILQYKKLLYTISGQAVPDNYSANYKLCSNFFNCLITQQNQYLLGNGVTWQEDSTSDALGKDFDTRLQEAGHEALISGVSFGFWNLDHLEVFNPREFAPLYDEENGSLSAGVRFWQIDDIKPLRATLYELDGYTDFIWRAGKPGQILHPKRPYIISVQTSEIDGTEIIDGKNYPSFPIVPLWGNRHHQSELIGLQESIDSYDLIRSGFANDLDDASQIYWTIQNAEGMDDIDLAKFVQRMRTVKAAVMDDNGARAESHTLEVPYASREALLTRLRTDIYEDFMALDFRNIQSGGATATQIKASYEPMNNKVDMYEYCVIDFLHAILALAGIEDDPTFTRSMIVNVAEEIQILLQSAEYLDSEYITRKILTLLGDGDQADEMLEAMAADELERGGMGNDEENLDEIEEDDDIDAQLDELEGSL